jgi:hypothetical protein
MHRSCDGKIETGQSMLHINCPQISLVCLSVRRDLVREARKDQDRAHNNARLVRMIKIWDAVWEDRCELMARLELDAVEQDEACVDHHQT